VIQGKSMTQNNSQNDKAYAGDLLGALSCADPPF
jgi:hypothetical protein